jgi:hypothetical protein
MWCSASMPSALDPAGQAGGAGLAGDKAGDRVHHRGPPAPAVPGTGTKHDPQGLADVEEVQASKMSET